MAAAEAVRRAAQIRHFAVQNEIVLCHRVARHIVGNAEDHQFVVAEDLAEGLGVHLFPLAGGGGLFSLVAACPDQLGEHLPRHREDLGIAEAEVRDLRNKARAGGRYRRAFTRVEHAQRVCQQQNEVIERHDEGLAHHGDPGGKLPFVFDLKRLFAEQRAA